MLQPVLKNSALIHELVFLTITECSELRKLIMTVILSIVTTYLLTLQSVRADINTIFMVTNYIILISVKVVFSHLAVSFEIPEQSYSDISKTVYFFIHVFCCCNQLVGILNTNVRSSVKI